MEYDRLLGELQKMHDEQDMEGEHIQAQVFIFIAISGQDSRWSLKFCNDITISDLNAQISHIGVEREKTDMKIEEEEELFKNLKSKVTFLKD